MARTVLLLLLVALAQGYLPCRSFVSPSPHACTSTSSLRMGSDERKPWPFGRFLRTLTFFNGPRLFTSAPARAPVSKSIGTAKGVVLVVGATGGVGKRVVKRLKAQGVPVRALVRNELKGRAFLSEDEPIEIVTADIKDPLSLKPSIFDGVTQIVICSAAIVQPREGDGPNREKYYQGIKFFEPEVVDKPEETDFRGIQNLVNAAAQHGQLLTKVIFSTSSGRQEEWKSWGSLDDVVMGGVSSSNLRVENGVEDELAGTKSAAVFTGVTRTANNGGFASVRTRNFDPPLDLSLYDAIELRLKGDGCRYKFMLRDEAAWDGISWCYSFDTREDEWQTIRVPFSKMIPVVRARTLRDGRKLNSANIQSIQLMLSKFEYDGGLNPAFKEGQFQLAVSRISAFKENQVPQIVYVSSAGVTRPGRPGIKLEEEPPAVRMNDMLGGILTYKLKGENVIRTSGLPYTIVRPCALTEEKPGAPMVFDQGDVIKGKISRNDVAELIVEALNSNAASYKTFEVKSNLKFSEPPPDTPVRIEFEKSFKEMVADEPGANTNPNPNPSPNSAPLNTAA